MILTRSNHVAAAAALRRTAQTQRDTHNTKEGREARAHTHTTQLLSKGGGSSDGGWDLCDVTVRFYAPLNRKFSANSNI